MNTVVAEKNGIKYRTSVHAEGGLSVQVYIQSYGNSVAEGTFITLPDREKYEFCGLDQMLLIMDDLMDRSCGKEDVPGHRYVYKKPYIFQKTKYPVTGPTSGDILDLCSKKVTFIIEVSYRRNMSMQGKLNIQVNRKWESLCFRSALELTRMLHEYLSGN